MAEQEVARKKEFLALLKEAAEEGIEGVFVLGEIEGRITPYTNDKGQTSAYADIICGRGHPFQTQFDPNGILPGVGHVGVFEMSPQKFGKNIGYVVRTFA